MSSCPHGLPGIAVLWRATNNFFSDCGWDNGVAAAAARIAGFLRDVPVFAGPTEHTAGVSRALAAGTALADLLASSITLPDAADVSPQAAVEDYFRLRTAQLSPQQAGLQAVRIICSALADLRNAPLAGHDLEWEIAAMRQVVHDVFGDDIGGGGADEITVDDPAAPSPEQMWAARWVIGHHVHALFNVMGTSALASTTAAVSVGMLPAAVSHLRRATVYSWGISASRAHATAVPGDFYRTQVRPTMLPPLVDIPLSGAQHARYRQYRRAVVGFLRTVPMPIRELAQREPELAFAREAFLEADLLEAERHVTIAAAAVGDSRSLIQTAAQGENAVSVLRQLRHDRAARATPFVRFGDHVAERGVQARQEAIPPS